jgi:S-adenosylmethionine:tRNA ribosyltransferase-isomerase
MRELAAPQMDAEASTRLADYDYDLASDLIAQVPAEERDAARLLVVGRSSGGLRHAIVRELPRYLRAGDLLVFNDARVRAARLHCRAASGGAVELLVLGQRAPQLWSCLGRPAKRLRPGSALVLPGGAPATVVERLAEGRYAVQVGAAVDLPALLAHHGEIPLPPYIKRPDGPLALDRERYQTVFAAHDGAVAAPTAGLHFTPALLKALDAAGVQRAALTLVVGAGTFLPVRAEDARDHHMEAEWAELPAATVEAIEGTKATGGRVIAVGTTTARALESWARAPGGFWADAFILPGFRFRVVDALLTNFHLPRSTLLMLVSAFAGRERILETYTVAVRERYRFYSYGDAMLIA